MAAVVREEIDHVLVDRETLAARPLRTADEICHLLGILSLVLPDQVAVGGVDRNDAATGIDGVHDTLMDDRRCFIGASRQAPRPGHLELARVALVDLIERTEALLIVGPIYHQPVTRRRVGEHVVGDRLEAFVLSKGLRCDRTEHRRRHKG